MIIKINPYKMASKSCKALSLSLSERLCRPVKRIKVTGSNYLGNTKHLVINWGSSVHRGFMDRSKVINTSEATAKASNKLLTLINLSESGSVNTPKFFVSEEEVVDYLSQDGDNTVLARTILQGHSGGGIVILKEGDDVPYAQLYTALLHKTSEFRVHVGPSGSGELSVFDFTKKRRRTGSTPEGVEKVIKSHDNGWIFVRNNANGEEVHIPQDVKQQAINAVKSLGLDFGAVDVVLSSGKAYVLEVNTAPGLEGTTLERYTDMLEKIYNNYAGY